MPRELTMLATMVSMTVSIGNLCIMLFALGKFIHKPTVTQDERLDSHDRRLDEVNKRIDHIEERLLAGSGHFDILDEGNSMMQLSLISIMDALEPLITDEDKRHRFLENKKNLYQFLINNKK